MSHDHKQLLNLAGEFLVVGELARRSVLSSITYGASKRADIFAFSDDRAEMATIEVKASDKRRWPLGTKVMDENLWKPSSFWILVDLSPKPPLPPRYFVLTAEDLGRRFQKGHAVYCDAYLKKHGRTYDGLNVPNINLSEIRDAENRWEIIEQYIKTRVSAGPRDENRNAPTRRPM